MRGAYRDTQLILNKPVAYTAHDANDIPAGGMKGFSVNADGNVALVPFGDTDVGGAPVDGTVFVMAVKAGVIYPCNVKRINATSTTATGIAVWY